jgi:LCP family protein required for cell wall assembly
VSSPDPGQYAPRRVVRKPTRRRHTVRNALLVAAALVLVVLVVVGIYVASIATAFNDKRQTVDAGIATQAAVDDGALNVLLLGSDSRGEGMDTAENKGEDGERSDTMMLVHVPEDRQDVYVMSLVRDLWVEIPGEGERKINAALGLGGYPLVTATVENLVGVNVDHLAVIDFEGFNGLTEAVGGVQVCNPNTFSSGQINPSYFPQGEILLQGADALRYVRERKAFMGGDFERVANQQRFVSAMVDQVLTVDTLANPQKLTDVINAIVPFITVDEGLDAATIAGYGLQLNGIRSGDIHTFTVPHGSPTEGPGGASIVEQDEEAMAELRRALQDDQLDEYLSGGTEEGQDGPDGGATPSGKATSPAPSAEPSSAPATTGTDEPGATGGPGTSDAPTPGDGGTGTPGGTSAEPVVPVNPCVGS